MRRPRPKQWLDGIVNGTRPLNSLVSGPLELWVAAQSMWAPARVSLQKKLVILATGRSGSTLLGSLLSSNPGVLCEHELFRRRIRYPLPYLERRARLAGTRVYGFNLLTYQIDSNLDRDPRRFLHDLHRAGFAVLHLHRDNHLHAALSHVLARATGDWILTTGTRRRAAPVRVSIDQLSRWHELVIRMAQQEREVLAGLPHLSLSYERHLEQATHHAATLRLVGEWLGVELARAETRLRKVVPPDLKRAVANYDDVREYAEGVGGLDHLES